MANNYLLFSEMLELKNKRERKWVQEELTRRSTEYDSNGDPEIDFEWRIEKKGLWIYSDVAGEPSKVGSFVQEFLKKFHPNNTFCLTWAHTCSSPRVGEFSGGAMVVTSKKLCFMSAGDWAWRQIQRLEKKARAQASRKKR